MAEKKKRNTGRGEGSPEGAKPGPAKKPATGRSEDRSALAPDAGENAATPSPDFPVVGIGASAGGLEAMEALFRALPTGTGMAFVVVVHLDPTHVSILPDLLQKFATMPVQQVRDGMTVEPDHIYVIPPNRDMTILNGTFQLYDLPKPRSVNLPIDHFLRSLAQDRGRRAVCVILSGTGTDGTLGVRAVKGKLGMVMVQDEESARYDGMPRSAMATGLVDYVLPPESMPERLIDYTAHSERRPSSRRATGGEHQAKALAKIFVTLRSRTQHDFSQYKENTILRRIERRMSVHQIDDLDEYVRCLQGSDGEAGILFKELLIGVTSFFRDPEAFRSLGKEFLPKLLESKPDDYAVRVWVPGCATGEEAYSLAITLHECMEQLGRHFYIQVFGTDIDTDAIATARAGLYPESIGVDVDETRLKRFFTKEGGGLFRIRKVIREMLVFAPQNAIKDPPFTKLDLISCRNLLIYLGLELQQKLLPLFHYSLKPDGLLLLGSSESIGTAGDLFSTASKKWKLFQRKDTGSRARPMLDYQPSPDSYRASDLPVPPAVQRAEEMSALQLVETILHQSDTPPCAIIDDSGSVVYIHGRTGRFLEPAEGRASVNLFDMARPGLRSELATAVRGVARDKQPRTCLDLVVDPGDDQRHANLTITPILEQTSLRGLMMVVFEESSQPSPSRSRAPELTSPGRSGKSVEQLEQDLKFTRASLQTTIEELEASNEELKSTNEELQSTNEELQSTNEELETSKEELQSLNEESATVNVELQARISELSRINDDMTNLLDSTEIATLFLDAELRVRRFTPRTTEIIPLTATDLGRPVRHLATTLMEAEVAELAREVLLDLSVRTIEVASSDDRTYRMRLRPYRTTANVIDGVVVTFEDISLLKRQAVAIRNSQERYRLLFDLSHDSIAVIDPATGAFVEVNQQMCEKLGYTPDELVRLSVADVEAAEDPGQVAKRLKDLVAKGQGAFETKHRAKDGSVRTVWVFVRVISLEERPHLLAMIRDPHSPGGDVATP